MASSDAQKAMYRTQAEAYETLIAAEDCDGRLREEVERRVDVRGKRLLDVGAGTGRLARWFAEHAKTLTLVEREVAMLEVAKGHLSEAATYHVADARELPVPTNAFDVAMAGWVFGHFRHWMPDGWEREVDQAIIEMRRAVVPGGALVVIETLGTGHETPRDHPALDEYFQRLESVHGFERTWARSDYRFETPEHAVVVLGKFFGETLVRQIQAQRWSTVPECTGLFVCANE
ncbi:MAG: class I SAM-dependent methyltransferase [Myxococcota bacterium]